MSGARWLSLAHAADHLDISVDALRRLVRMGKLPQPTRQGSGEIGWHWRDDAAGMLDGFQPGPQPDAALAAEIVEAAEPLRATESGIYFLICKREVVYVGQAINVLARIGQHTKSDKAFDSWAWIPCANSDLDRVEIKYIQRLRPVLNKTGLCGLIVGHV